MSPGRPHPTPPAHLLLELGQEPARNLVEFAGNLAGHAEVAEPLLHGADLGRRVEGPEVNRVRLDAQLRLDAKRASLRTRWRRRLEKTSSVRRSYLLRALIELEHVGRVRMVHPEADDRWLHLQLEGSLLAGSHVDRPKLTFGDEDPVPGEENVWIPAELAERRVLRVVPERLPAMPVCPGDARDAFARQDRVLP